MARIKLDGVAKAWGDVVAVKDINLDIADGEFVAILGPSGCGKSTTLFMLAGIYAPTEGEIRFDDHIVNEVEVKDRNVGIVFQSYALYPHMTVRENIQFPLRFKKIRQAEAVRLAEDAARLVHVEELLDRKPSQMSGGQQQRVALARALVKRPQLLLLDEPLSNLDATLRLTMRADIRALQRQLGVTTILVTHDQLEATTMADRIICMSKGRIEQVGTADDLYLRPESLFVASFIGAPPINLLDGGVQDGQMIVGETRLSCESVPVGPVVLGVRPEHVQLNGGGIPATVDHVEPMGRESLLWLNSPMGPIRALTPRAGSSAEKEFPVGGKVGISFEPGVSMVFDKSTDRRIKTAQVGDII